MKNPLHRLPRPGLLSAGGLFLLLLLPAAALAQSDPIPDGNVDVPRSAPSNPAGSLALPSPMPAVTPFDKLVTFPVEHSQGREYAVDPASIRFHENIVMLTLGVRGRGGAVNTSYTAIDCKKQQYLLMAYETKGQWKPMRNLTRWRKVMDLKKRRYEFSALFAAGCELGGFRVKRPQDLVQRLREHRLVNQ